MTTPLQEQLSAPHAQLERTQAVDAQSRELLLEVLAYITRLLSRSGSPIEQQGVVQRLDELAVQFEADHPSLGTAIRQLVDTLGKAGI